MSHFAGGEAPCHFAKLHRVSGVDIARPQVPEVYPRLGVEDEKHAWPEHGPDNGNDGGFVHRTLPSDEGPLVKSAMESYRAVITANQQKVSSKRTDVE